MKKNNVAIWGKNMVDGVKPLLFLTILVVTFLSVIKFRAGEINYYNSDATWHTLVIVEAYNETPASEHLFLPIISLGGQDNKDIPCGTTIPDEHGNYYYTSFTSAGFFLPWAFMKLLHLPANETSLYIFNSILFALSALCWTLFIYDVYNKNKNRLAISVVAMLTYVSAPEILHGMGITYWPHSIMQVTLLLQIMAYKKMREGSEKAKAAFYILSLINPYVEWTGYVANVGFALLEFFSEFKNSKGVAIKKALIIGLITFASMLIFIGNYLLLVDPAEFFATVKNRFFARNIYKSTVIIDILKLLTKYIISFKFLWVALVCLFSYNIIKYKKIPFKHLDLMFLLAFPILENFIMQGHANTYSYDRMKVIFILSFTITELMAYILENENKELVKKYVAVLVSACCALNIMSYVTSKYYIWPTNFRQNNERFAEHINEEYEDCVIGTKEWVFGYLNLLFDRNIYTEVNEESIKEYALQRGKKYAILLHIDPQPQCWTMHKLGGATVYDVEEGTKVEITV